MQNSFGLLVYNNHLHFILFFVFLSTEDLPPQDRERSKTLPKSYGKKRAEQQQNNSNGESTKSLPRNSSSVCLIINNYAGIL